MKKSLASIILMICWLCGSLAQAAPQQDHEAIRATVLAFARTQTGNLPGEVDIKVSPIDRRLKLPSCDHLQAFIPTGTKLIGKTSIGVRCNTTPSWSVFVQTDIRVTLDLLVANRPLAQGTVLSAADFSLQRGELGRPGILTAQAQAVGKTLKFAIGAGQVLRDDMLRAPLLIKQGQNVILRAQGPGYALSREGLAMNNAGDGETVRIRVDNSLVITARAAGDGWAEVMQ